MFVDIVAILIAITPGGGCIDAMPCFKTNEGSVVVERAPDKKTNPTLICPNGATWQPGQPCM